MKVTKRVEEIIVSRVNAKFDSMRESLEKMFEEKIKAEEEAVEQMNQEIIAFIKGQITERYAHIFADLGRVVKRYCDAVPTGRYIETASSNKEGELRRKLLEKSRKASEDIVLALEMGGTLDTLEDMLSKIDTSIDVEEE